MALLFHVFNNLELSSNVKVFHLFAGICAALSLIIGRKDTATWWLLLAMVLLTFLSSIFSVFPHSLMTALTFFIIVMGCYGLRYVDYRQIIVASNVATAVCIPAMLYFYYQSGGGGYYL